MLILTLFFSGIIVFSDQLIKLIVSQTISPQSSVAIIPTLLDVCYVENRGAALGMLQNSRWILIAASLIIICFFIYILQFKKIKSKLFFASSALIMGGAIGNLIDRIFNGYVIDYLKLSFFAPVCNLSDYCVTLGAIMLIIYVFFFRSKNSKNKYGA